MARLADSPNLDRFRTPALAVGVIGLVLAVLGAFLGLEQFFHSYLYAFMFWLGISMGCLFLLLLHHLAGGSWSAMIRRPLEAGVSLIPVMALFFIPLLFSIPFLYEWSHHEHVAHNPILQQKVPYLNVPFFIGRAIFYFLVWIAMSVLLRRWSLQQDETADPRLADRFRALGAGGIILYVLTMTFAAFDWGMSLDPEWFSGMYGVIIMIGQVISAVALMVFVMALLGRYQPVASLLNEKRTQDLGNLLMAFSMFWAYVSASQLIIIWSGNIIETNPWYVVRLSSYWAPLGGFLILFHFFVPFLILFSRWVKRKARLLLWIAGWIMFMRLVDLFWIFMPSFGRPAIAVSWLDLAILLGIGGIWLTIYIRQLGSRPLLPLHDHRLAKALAPKAVEHHG
jgi:hypothetical protein